MRFVSAVLLCIVAAAAVCAELVGGVADYESLYHSAVESYLGAQWAQCVVSAKDALASYRKLVDVVVNCRIKCDDQRVGTGPERATVNAFYAARAAQARCLRNCAGVRQDGASDATLRDFRDRVPYYYLQRCYFECKEQCPDQLSYLDGHRRPNFFASFYHYLQFSYYQLGKLEKACEATQSYLLLVPDDSDMWYNQAFYAQLPATQDAWFKARQEVEEYVRRREEEQETIKAIELQLGTVVAKPQVRESSAKDSSFNTSRVTVIQDEKALNGTRVVAEGFLTEDECTGLLSLADTAALTGDGYDGKQSPHSKFETFEGITAGRIALLTRNGQIDKHQAELFIEASERVRMYVESYFNLNAHLYFSYTHLVCRKAMSGASRRPESDMSHSIHADNCILQKSGNCLKQLPAYIWRDFRYAFQGALKSFYADTHLPMPF
ncbi:hypothetical protein HPB51_003872 [Rhipicephalus microplus]|uniref:Leprecan-like alpha-helical domain-containing protein n=1 Tax=Rhipicephalus microplus TaxID=6941 RepID=A0A9J6EL85_RHIMP|nr:hypothetical protein HPB51_003872 [Rhipicephalus microplus]